MQANGQNVALAGFWQTGSLDTSFGNGGTSVLPFPGVASGAAVDSKQRIVVVGTGPGPVPQIVLTRFNPDGKSVDASFGNNGVVVTNFNGGATGRAVAIASQDHIVVAGETNGILNVVLFDQNGAPPQGFVVCPATKPADWTGEAQALTIDTSGRIVATGARTSASGTQAYREFWVARFTSDGCADPSFADGTGINRMDASLGAAGTWQAGMAVTIDPSGRILVAGPTWWWNDQVSNGACMTVIRYLGDGFLDTTFGGSGMAGVLIDAPGIPWQPQQLAKAIVLTGGAIWVVGTYKGQFKLARFDFNGNATLLKSTDVGAGAGSVANALILSPNNVLLAGGSAGATEFAMAEYDLNGNLVNGFGAAGIEKLDANCAMSDSIAGLANQWVGGWLGYYRIIAAGPSGSNACLEP